MLKNWIDFLTIVIWMVLGLVWPIRVIRSPKDWRFATWTTIYLALAVGVTNLVLTGASGLIS